MIVLRISCDCTCVLWKGWRMWSLDSVVGTRSLLKQFPILASYWSVRAQIGFSLVTVHHQLSQIFQPTKIWDMRTSNYLKQNVKMFNCSRKEIEIGFSVGVIVFCKYCFLKSVSPNWLEILETDSACDCEEEVREGSREINKFHGETESNQDVSEFTIKITEHGMCDKCHHIFDRDWLTLATFRGLVTRDVAFHWSILSQKIRPLLAAMTRIQRNVRGFKWTLREFSMHRKKSQEFH